MPEKILDTSELKQILEEIRVSNSLLRALVATTAASGLVGMTNSDKVRLLSEVGLKPIEIARVMAISPNTVSVMLYQSKKKDKKIGSKKESK